MSSKDYIKNRYNLLKVKAFLEFFGLKGCEKLLIPLSLFK